MKVVYRDTSGKKQEWEGAMWYSGFNTCITDLCKKLNVGERWFKESCLNDLPFVVYSPEFIYMKTGNHKAKLTYVRYDDFIKWTKEKGLFEKQTETIDFYSYLALADKKKADKIYKEYKKCFEKNPGFYRKGTIPDKVFKKIRDQFHLSSDVYKNANCVKRKEIPFTKVEPFNFFERDYYFLDPDATAETVYRQAFLNGDTKVTLGKGKVLFVKNNQDISKMKMPFVVKAGANILVK